MTADFLSDEQATLFGRTPDELAREDLERFCSLDDADSPGGGSPPGEKLAITINGGVFEDYLHTRVQNDVVLAVKQPAALTFTELHPHHTTVLGDGIDVS